MDFWNVSIPALTFTAPLLACLYTIILGRAGAEGKFRWGAFAFGFTSMVALVGAARFAAPVRLEFWWPFAAESSGYFEFALQLHWTRYLWILFTNLVLLAFVFLDGKSVFQGQSRGFKFMFLSVASIFSSLAYLSENLLLSLLFIEIMIFLLHSFSVSEGGKEAELERVSYFKRSSFIFIALLTMVALASWKGMNSSYIMLLGLVLYFLAFIFSKHNFVAWSYQSLQILQMGALFFLLGRLMREDLAPELWLPLAIVFGVAAAAFSAFTLLARTALGSAFWLTFTVFSYLLFLRFSSGRPEEPFWPAYEGIALASALAIGNFYRFSQRTDQAWQKLLYVLLSALLLGVVSGAIPGVDVAGVKPTGESPMKLMALGALTFLLALVVGKSLSVSQAEKTKGKSEGNSFLPAFLPAAFVILLQIAAVVRIVDLYGESPFRMGPAYLLTNLHIVTCGSSLILGIFAGYLLGSRSGFVAWIENKEWTMEELFPSVDPVIIRWNERIFRAPDRGMDWIAGRTSKLSSGAAGFLQVADRTVFGDKLYQGIRGYSSSLSRLARYVHSGSIRTYLFLGILVSLLASMLFLLEGK